MFLRSLQNGVHGEVRGHHSALQRQVYQDSTRSAWCVYFRIRSTWSGHRCCWILCADCCLLSLTCAWLLQCLQSLYYVSLQTEVRRRGRTRGNTSRMDGLGPETQTRWANESFLQLQTWTSRLAFLPAIEIKNIFRKLLNFFKLVHWLADSFFLSNFRTSRHQRLHDLTGFESCSLFSQGGMTLAYDPTALQNGWVVCRDRRKTTPLLRVKVLVEHSNWSDLVPPSGHFTNLNFLDLHLPSSTF